MVLLLKWLVRDRLSHFVIQAYLSLFNQAGVAKEDTDLPGEGLVLHQILLSCWGLPIGAPLSLTND